MDDVFQEEFVYMKNREKTGKAFRIKWLLLALVAAALIFVPAVSHKVSAASLFIPLSSIIIQVPAKVRRIPH